MRFFSLKHSLIVVALLVGCLVFAACGDHRSENPRSEAAGLEVNGQGQEFVNEQLVPENPLFIPPLLEPRLENGKKVFDSDPNLPYMFHCHILEHEDMGMMGQFVVVENLSDEVQIQSSLIASVEAHNGHH